MDHLAKAQELKERSLAYEASASKAANLEVKAFRTKIYFPEKAWLMALSRSLVPAGADSPEPLTI